MRSDAANLLARLGRKDFRYREFTDNFADMELWPIFEALLTDERVVGVPISALAARNVQDIIPATKASPVSRADRGSSATIFGSYGTSTPSAPPSKERGELRSFLQRLSDNDREAHD